MSGKIQRKLLRDVSVIDLTNQFQRLLPQRYYTHDKGQCRRKMSWCSECISLSKIFTVIRRNGGFDVFDVYFSILDRMSNFAQDVRVGIDKKFLSGSTDEDRHIFYRALKKTKKTLSKRLRDSFFASEMAKLKKRQDVHVERMRARDAKYELHAQGDAEESIGHSRGTCENMLSMCEDCVSVRRVELIAIRVPARRDSALYEFMRILRNMSIEMLRDIDTETWVYLEKSTPDFQCRFRRAYERYQYEFPLANRIKIEEWLRVCKWKYNMKECCVSYDNGGAVYSIEYKRLHAQGLFDMKLDIEHHIPALEQLVNMLNRDDQCGLGIVSQRVISFVFMVESLINAPRIMDKISAVTNCVFLFGLSSVAGMATYAQSLAQVFVSVTAQMNPHRLVAQGGESRPLVDEHILSGTARLILGLIGVTNYNPQEANARVKKLDNLARLVTSMDKLYGFVSRMLEYGLEMARSSSTGFSSVDELKVIDNDIPAWIEDVTQYYSNGGKVKCTRSRREAMRVRAWKMQGDAYSARLMACRDRYEGRMFLHGYQVFRTAYMQVKEMFDESALFFCPSSLRAAPLTIYLHGTAGVGKSILQNQLVTALMTRIYKRRGEQFVPGQDIYMRNPVQKHWDGYSCQPVVIFDDYLQSKDSEDMVTQLLDLIRCKNNQSYNVEMANLSSKGNTFFESELLMITSNIMIPNDAKLVVRSDEAVWRRVDLMVEVRVRPEYADNERIDPLKVAAAFPVEIIDGVEVAGDASAIYLLTVRDNHQRVILRNGTFDQLLDLAESTFDRIRHLDHLMINRMKVIAGVPLHAQGLSAARYSVSSAFQRAVVNPIYYYLYPECDTASHRDIVESEGITDQVRDIFARMRQAIVSSPLWNKYVATGIAISVVMMLAQLWSESRKEVFQVESQCSGDDKTRIHRARVMIAESTVSGDDRTRVQRSRMRIEGSMELPCDIITPDGMRAQSCSDMNSYQLAVNKLANNAATIRIDLPGTGRDYVMRALFVCGRIFVVPMHAFHELDYKDVSFSLILLHGQRYNIRMNECEWVVDKEKDLVFVQLPKRYNNFVDIRNHFHSEGDINKVSLKEAMLWVIDGESQTKIACLAQDIKKNATLEYEVSSHFENPDSVINIVNSYRYNVVARDGYCGAPLVWLNPSVQGGKILGIHVAGSTHVGLTTPITREYLSRMLSRWNIVSIIAPDTNMAKPLVAQGMCYYGNVDLNKQVRIPSETMIRKSAIFGVFEPTTKPAMLRPKGQCNPLRIGILKQKVDPVVFPQVLVDLAVEDLGNAIIGRRSRYSDIGVLDVHQALNGIPGDRWVCPMNMHTSPGYPYVLETKFPGKFYFLTGDVGHYELTKRVENERIKRLNFAQHGIVEPTLFMDILKDERRAIAKVDAGKTRIFNVAPFDLNILVRQYCQSFVAHVMDDHIYGECSVGLNVHSDEWGMLVRHLRDMNGNYLGGDYGNYDKQLSYQVLQGVLSIINRFYDDDNDRIREVLFDTMFSAFHIAGKEVYRVHQGNPSGIVMTAIVNSIANSIMMRVVWMLLGGDIMHFQRDVCLKVYGDDNVASIRPEANWFNMRSVSSKFAEYGIEYTTPNKHEITTDYLVFDEVTYLKRGFVLRQGRWYAPLDINSIHEMVNWIRKSNDDDFSLRANYECACREMYHYGRPALDGFVRHVRGCSEKLGVSLPTQYYHSIGQYWGSEDSYGVILRNTQTEESVAQCCHVNMEDGCSAIANASASLNKGSSVPSLALVRAQGLSQRTATSQAKISSMGSTQNPVESDGRSNMAEDMVTTTHQITSFMESSQLTAEVMQGVQNIPPIVVDPYMKETIVDWLQRPYNYDTVWTSASPMGTLLAQFTFPNFLWSIPSLYAKLQNFSFFRAGVRVCMRINGTRFHYGQLLIAWSPLGNNIGEALPAYNNIYTQSSFPSITISASDNEVHEMIMPFSVPYNWVPVWQDLYPTPSSNFEFGVVSIYVMNPLLSSSPTTGVPDVGISLFANFENVEVAGYSPRINASGPPSRYFADQESTPAILPTTPPANFFGVAIAKGETASVVRDPKLKAQGRREEAQSKSERGIIGRLAETVGTIAGTLSVVPEIGAVATAVGIGSKVVGAIANTFGWILPSSLIANQPVIVRYSNLANTHGLCDAPNLGIDPENSTSSAHHIMGSPQNEMQLSHIFGTPSPLAIGVVWPNDASAGYTIFTADVHPNVVFNDTNGITYPTLISFGSAAFRYWRGSIRYHVQVVCSQMHVGRLRIGWAPFSSTAEAITAVDDFANMPNMVLDISKQTEVSFTVPYLAGNPWLNTINSGGYTFWTRAAHVYYMCNGSIYLTVLNELSSPTVPVTPVYVNIWAYAGEDFQVMAPSDDYMNTYWYQPPSDEANADQIEARQSGPLKAQGMTREQIRRDPAPPLIPAKGAVEDKLCSGEIVTHLKELLLRPCFWFLNPATTTTSILVSPFNAIRWSYPPTLDSLQCQYLGLNASGTPSPTTTYMDYFRQIFRYSRGSFTVRYLNATSQIATGYTYDNQTSIQNARIVYDGYASTNALVQFRNIASSLVFGTSYLPGAPGTAYAVTSTQPAQATLPWYCTNYAMQNFTWNGVNTSTSTLIYASYPAAIVTTSNNGGSCMVSAGDDYELGFLIGPPATPTWSAVVVVGP